MICLRRPSDDFLERILHQQEHEPFSYTPIGVTAGADAGGIPGGYHRDRFETDLGADQGGRFERAGQALLEWIPQQGAGIRVFPGAAVAADQAFVLALPLPLAGWALASGRVAYMVDEPDRFGYAYGTLPDHPEQGEEAFIVGRTGGRVRFEVIAVSRPRDPLARLGAPVARALQLRTIRTYLRAMQTACA